MRISNNKKFQYLFFFILSICVIFNGGNSNLMSQIIFITFSSYFLIFLKNKNYKMHLNAFYLNYKNSIFFYCIFLIYLLFQIVPLPINLLKIFSPEKFIYLSNIQEDIHYSSISLSPSNSFFQLLNFFSFLILVFIIKMVFYSDRHKKRLFIFISLIGFISSIVALGFYFIGNPDYLFIKNSFYSNSSTGFFINRTVFSIFCLFCLIASLELLKEFDKENNIKNKDNFFIKNYIRLFIIFISIGIITSFSRIGNFLLLLTIFFYLLGSKQSLQLNNKSFKYTIIFIFIFDIVILGIFFGSSKLIERFSFINNEFSHIFAENYNQMVLVKDIEMYSLCEHHMLPFNGRCHVAYIPDGKVLGLSKVARIVDMFARRLQIQERLTNDVAEAITKVTGCKGCAVVIEAQHLCMQMRGVQKQNSITTSSSFSGIFMSDEKTRAEFMNLIK